MYDLNLKVLVVEDMGTMRRLVKKFVLAMGFKQVEDAADGQLAWAKLNEMPDIGLIISDWNMPNCTGLDLLKRVRADSRFSKVPFFLLTAEGEAEQVKAALGSGVSGYILKPFTYEALLEKLEQTSKKSEAA
jgi:two-component system chemotaxis response regulator CheY